MTEEDKRDCGIEITHPEEWCSRMRDDVRHRSMNETCGTPGVQQHLDGVSSIAVLPWSVIAIILSMVHATADRNRVSRVCRCFRYFERLSRVSLVVRAPQQVLGLVPLCFSSVTNLDLSALTIFPEDGASCRFDTPYRGRLARAFPKVRTLKVMAVSDDSIRDIGRIWPLIENFSVTKHKELDNPPRLRTVLETFAKCQVLDAKNLQIDSLAADLSKLKTLALTSVSLETQIVRDDLDMELLAQKCPRLESLCITVHPGRMKGNGFLSLATRCRKLTKLKVFMYMNPVKQFNLENSRKSLVALARMTSELPDIEIDLSFQHVPAVVTGYRLECLQGLASNIRSLVLYTSDASMEGIWGFTNLTELTLGDCESLVDQDLVSIVRRCPKLITLRILDCKRITQRGLKIVSETMKLRSLSLCFLRVPVKDQIDAIMSMSSSLSAIRLMVNGPVDSLSTQGCWPNLTRLEITLTNLVPQKVLMEPWLGSCPKLKHLGLVIQHWCPSTLAFLSTFPSLSSLSLSFSTALTRKMVLLFLEDIASLEELITLSLFISDTEWLSEEAGTFFESCPKLKSLNIFWIGGTFIRADSQFKIRPLLIKLLGMKCLQDIQLPSFLADDGDLKIFYRGLHAHTVQSILRSINELQSRDSRVPKRIAVLHVREVIVGEA